MYDSFFLVISVYAGVPQRSDAGMRSTVVPVPGRYTTTPFEPRIPAAETRFVHLSIEAILRALASLLLNY